MARFELSSLVFKGTNLLNFSSIRVPAIVNRDFKECLLPFREMLEYFNMWADGTCNMSIDSKTCVLKHGKSEVELPLYKGVDDFKSRFPAGSKKRGGVNVSGLSGMLGVVAPTIDPKSKRDYLHGVHISAKKNLFVVEGGDGFQLARIEVAPMKFFGEVDCSLRKEGAALLMSAPDIGHLFVDGSYLVYSTGTAVFKTLLLNVTQFPDIRSIFNPPKDCKVLLKRDGLEEALKGVQVFGADRITFSPGRSGLDVTAGTLPRYDGEITAKIKGKMPTITLSPAHLSYLLGMTNGNVQLMLGTETDQVWYADTNGLTYIFTPYGSA